MSIELRPKKVKSDDRDPFAALADTGFDEMDSRRTEYTISI